MTDKPAPKRVRSRAPNVAPFMDAAELDREAAALFEKAPPALTAADLKTELDSLSATRTQVAGAITATAEQHARLTSDLARVDGALQIVGQLIERLEAKAT